MKESKRCANSETSRMESVTQAITAKGLCGPEFLPGPAALQTAGCSSPPGLHWIACARSAEPGHWPAFWVENTSHSQHKSNCTRPSTQCFLPVHMPPKCSNRRNMLHLSLRPRCDIVAVSWGAPDKWNGETLSAFVVFGWEPGQPFENNSCTVAKWLPRIFLLNCQNEG